MGGLPHMVPHSAVLRPTSDSGGSQLGRTQLTFSVPFRSNNLQLRQEGGVLGREQRGGRGGGGGRLELLSGAKYLHRSDTSHRRVPPPPAPATVASVWRSRQQDVVKFLRDCALIRQINGSS